MKRDSDQEWSELEEQVKHLYPEDKWGGRRNERSFLLDIIKIAKNGGPLEAFSILRDIVRINFSSKDTTPAITYGNNTASDPALFYSMTEKLKTRCFGLLQEAQLSDVQQYLNANHKRAEIAFLSDILSKMNKDSTHDDYAAAANELSTRISVGAARPFSKSVLVYKNADGKDSRINDIKDFKAALSKIHEFAVHLAENIHSNEEYPNVIFYPVDSSGTIKTPAFVTLSGTSDRPNNLECSAAKNPGCSLKDITRNTKIGSKSIIQFFIEIIDENHPIREKLENPKGLTTIQWVEEKIKEEANIPDMINEAALASKEHLGPDPLNHKILLIKILSAFDKGLEINCNQLYEAYKGLYDQCYNLFKDQPAKVGLLIKAAEKLLVAHSRDYREIVQLNREYYYLKPLIISGTHPGSSDNVVKIFDQRDNNAMIIYLDEYKATTQNLLPWESQAIEKIQQYLQNKDNRLIDNSDLLEQFGMFVATKEGMINFTVETPDHLIVNQCKRCLDEMRQHLDKLKQNGASTQDIEKIGIAINHLAEERNKIIQQYPNQLAVKEELLSMGQLIMNTFYSAQLQSDVTVNNKPILGPSILKEADLAFVFEEGKAFYRATIRNNGLFSDNLEAYDLTDKEHPEKSALTGCIKVNVSPDRSDTTQGVPRTKTTLTNLVLVSTTPNIQFRSAMGNQLTPAKVESADLGPKTK